MPSRKQKTPQTQSPTYRNPPEAYRFRPGQSGNPSGRPKGIRSFAKELEAQLGKTVTVKVRGRSRTMTKLEAVTQTLADGAVAGDARMVRLLLDRLGEAEARAAEEPAAQETFSAADREVIAALLARIGGRDGGTADIPSASSKTSSPVRAGGPGGSLHGGRTE
jgi:Family of unknown function (DUF5681)